jgi:hypothetical protein
MINDNIYSLIQTYLHNFNIGAIRFDDKLIFSHLIFSEREGNK